MEERYQICPGCSAMNLDASKYCGNCGAPLGSAVRYALPVPEIQSEKDFFKVYASRNTKILYNLQIVLCFFSALVALVNTIWVSPIFLIDLAFLGIMGAAMLIRKNRVFPILIFAYSIIGSLMSIVNSGVPSGIPALIIAGLLIRSMNKLHAAYQAYLEAGTRPPYPL